MELINSVYETELHKQSLKPGYKRLSSMFEQGMDLAYDESRVIMATIEQKMIGCIVWQINNDVISFGPLAIDLEY